MNRTAIRLLICSALLPVLAVLALAVFRPRRYAVPVWRALPGTRTMLRPDGSRIAWQLLDPEIPLEKPSLVFLQGGPGGCISSRTIRMLQPFAAAGFRVLAYDPIGSGSSSRLGNIREYTVARHLDDLDVLVSQLGSGRVVLLGQSWGGILAALYAAAHPGRVAAIVFTCPGPLPGIRPEQRALPPPDSLALVQPLYSNRQANDRMANLRTRATAFLALHTGLKLMPDAEADAFQSALTRLLNRSTYCDTALAPRDAQAGSGYYAQLMTIRSLQEVPDPRRALRQFRGPVLILKGQCDNQPWGVTREYADLFSGSRLLVVPGAGHNIFAERPCAYSAAILRFLDTTCSGY